jgi:hypothetical protein
VSEVSSARADWQSRHTCGSRQAGQAERDPAMEGLRDWEGLGLA